MTTLTHSPRQRLSLDLGWRFHLGDPTAKQSPDSGPNTIELGSKSGYASGAAQPRYDDQAWRAVNLPHDWVVEGTFSPAANMDHGFLQTGIGWYRKTFHLPAEDLGKRLYLEFDGIFRNATVWLNGHRLGAHASGYTSFRYDISDVAEYGVDNVIAVLVDATQTEGWWYEGGGIYRHVWLLKVHPLHVIPWGVFVQSSVDQTSGDCELTIQTTLTNGLTDPARCRVESQVLDAEGKVVARARTVKNLAVDEQVTLTQRIELKQPHLWSVDAPYLYRLITTVKTGRTLVDACETTFGVRSIGFDAETGFYLNNKPLKLKGTCNHQDHAGVGVALPDRLFDYRIRCLKEMGCNAYRCAHNPPAPELLDACDRLGMLVMDETRHMDSTPEGLAQLDSMVLRDRNHPSIILWSLGNEEPLQGSDVGARIITTMKRRVRQLDPSRLVTLAMNGHWGSAASQALDVQGCNYFIQGYDDYHQRFPAQPVLASENGSTVCTRGIYANDEAQGYVSAYDANFPPWAFTARDSWTAVAERPFMAGTFVWTGFDYRGEPTPYRWPCINSHFGILDMCGYPKDNFYYYQAWWSNHDVLHILPHWNWAGHEGEAIAVWVYSNCDEVELFLNGQSLGRQAMPRNGRLEWQVAYTPGVLQAHGYRAGERVHSAERRTTGSPAAITLQAENTTLYADEQDIAIMHVAVVDAQGLVVPTANPLIRFRISDNAHILGVGNGDPSSHAPDKAQQRHAFNGLCQVIVQAHSATGLVELTAEADGLQAATLTLEALPAPARRF
jgi:beta-galactosidase